MKKNPNPFTAVVLAADRGAGDPVARTVGAPCKSLVPLGGRPMVLRVLDALGEARETDALMVCGPSKAFLPHDQELLALITAGKVSWAQPQATPSASVYEVLDSFGNETPVLVTTADHAFLNAEIVDYFCCEARAADCDVVVGLASHDEVMRKYPQTRRTATRLREGGFCSCNLFAFMTPHARRAADFWQKCERNRKKPWRMIGAIGWTVAFRYLLGKLSLHEGLERLSKRMSVKAGAVILPFPEAAVDVDTVRDWRIVEEIIGGRAI